jgi:hypothetical protein
VAAAPPDVAAATHVQNTIEQEKGGRVGRLSGTSN